jgi:FkbM family methyltransferase
MHHGSLSPTVVRIPGYNHSIEVNPEDPRARGVLIKDFAKGKISKPLKLWRQLVLHLDPDLVVDVGANYGECLFGTTYSTECRLFGFEANPLVFQTLSRSVAHHPNSRQVMLNHVLVSDQPTQEGYLYVDPAWSGTATAVEGIHDPDATNRYQVAVNTLDNLIPAEVSAAKTLLYKIDIEGYEPRAFGGFSMSLERVAVAIGIIEFNSQFLKLAGTAPEQFLADLLEHSHVFRLAEGSLEQLIPVDGLASLPVNPKRPGHIHTDLILIKRVPEWRECLPENFKIL